MAELSGSNSAVECQLPKLDVAGSIPVSRSNFFNGLREFFDIFFFRVYSIKEFPNSDSSVLSARSRCSREVFGRR